MAAATAPRTGSSTASSSRNQMRTVFTTVRLAWAMRWSSKWGPPSLPAEDILNLVTVTRSSGNHPFAGTVLQGLKSAHEQAHAHIGGLVSRALRVRRCTDGSHRMG